MPWTPPADEPSEARSDGAHGTGPGWRSASPSETGDWPRPPWSGRNRPHGSQWFAVIVAALLQLPGLIIAARAVPADPVALGFTLLAFAASFVLLAARRHPGLTVAVVAALCAPAIAVTTGPPFSAV